MSAASPSVFAVHPTASASSIASAGTAAYVLTDTKTGFPLLLHTLQTSRSILVTLLLQLVDIFTVPHFLS